MFLDRQMLLKQHRTKILVWKRVVEGRETTGTGIRVLTEDNS